MCNPIVVVVSLFLLVSCRNINELSDDPPTFFMGPLDSVVPFITQIDPFLEIYETIVRNEKNTVDRSILLNTIRSIEKSDNYKLSHHSANINIDLLNNFSEFYIGQWEAGYVTLRTRLSSNPISLSNNSYYVWNKHFDEPCVIQFDSVTIFYLTSPPQYRRSKLDNIQKNIPLYLHPYSGIAILSPSFENYEEGLRLLWKWHRLARLPVINSDSSPTNIRKYKANELLFLSYFNISLYDKYHPQNLKILKRTGIRRKITFFSLKNQKYYKVKFKSNRPFLFYVSKSRRKK